MDPSHDEDNAAKLLAGRWYSTEELAKPDSRGTPGAQTAHGPTSGTLVGDESAVSESSDGGLDIVASGVAGGASSCATAGESSCATTGGAGCATTGACGTPAAVTEGPPLPFVTDGTGPGADGVGTTPVWYACVHHSTSAT